MNISEKLNNLPHRPGVYLMRDKDNNIIYVGKSASLKDRIKSYFAESGKYDRKVSAMIANIVDFNYIVTNNEMEALMLESKLIKKHKPKYNVLFKDDKTYPYLKLTINEDFPRLVLTRRVLPDGAKYFGPFVFGSVRELLKVIHKSFKIRDCSMALDKKLERPCLKEEVGACSAPCVKGKITKEYYRKLVNEVIKFLNGKQDELVKKLDEKMKKASDSLRFEDAAIYRDQKELVQLIKLQNLNKGQQIRKALLDLKKILNLHKDLHVIEAVDISNTAGSQPSGAVVRFKDGEPEKAGYRKFKIRDVTGPDDTGMIKEVVKRRYKRAIEENTLPDLILIDGGKGQLNAATKAIGDLKLNLPVVSIAKKEEEVFIPGKNNPVKLPKDSATLHLIQRIRDEAHRFALRYHTDLRNREMEKSVLDEIKGIGDKRKTFILKNIKDIKNIKSVPKPLIESAVKKLNENK